MGDSRFSIENYSVEVRRGCFKRHVHIYDLTHDELMDYLETRSRRWMAACIDNLLREVREFRYLRERDDA